MRTHVQSMPQASPPEWPRIGQPEFGRIADVCALVRFGKSHVLSLVRQGRFPQPIREGDRLTLFRLDEVRGWIESRTAEARTRTAVE